MEYIKTSKDKRFNVAHCGSMNDMLFITFIGYNFVEISTVFSNPEETQTIEHYYAEDSLLKSYSGFTILTDMTLEDTDMIRITLKKPE